MLKKIITILISFCLLFEQSGLAQVAGPLVLPAFMGGVTAGDAFRPEHLRSIAYEPMDASFKTLLDKGSTKEKDQLKLENSTRQLFKYFFIGLSLPNESFWVNLRPDSADNIIDEYLAKTDIGKVMLEADVQLKKDTARYTAPDTTEGRAYWDKLYRKAQELFENENSTIPTLTRPWIVPDEIILRQSANNVYIYKATLKVMLEADYLKDSPEYSFNDPRLRELNNYSSQLIRELVLPKLTRDVNTSRRYASLRQVYFSLILAQWFKNTSQVTRHKSQGYDLLGSKIDSRDLNGLSSQSQWTKDTYFKEYQKSFKNGEYNKQENIQTAYGISLRQYFSGGIELNEIFKFIEPNDLVEGNRLLNFTLKNTALKKITIYANNFFKIENIQTGASQPGDGLPIVGNPSPSFAGAPVSTNSKKDGGTVAVDSLAQVLKIMRGQEDLANSVLVMDIDDTLMFHKWNYPSQKVVAKLIEILSAGRGFKDLDVRVWKKIMDRCKRLERIGLKTGIFEKVEGVNELLEFCRDNKVKFFIATNREESLREDTLKALNYLGIPIEQAEDVIFAGKDNGKAVKLLERMRGQPFKVFLIDNNKDNVEKFSRQMSEAKVAVQAFHFLEAENAQKKVEDTYEYYMSQLESLILTFPEASEYEKRTARLELLLVSALLKIAEPGPIEQPIRLEEVRRFMESPRLEEFLRASGTNEKTFLREAYLKEYLSEIEEFSGENKDGGVKQQGTDASIKPGGIDLRDLRAVAHPEIKDKFGQADDFRSNNELDNQWMQIQELVNKGFIPQASRINEYLQACRASKMLPAGREEALGCIAEILRMEEDHYLSTEPCLKELLALLEAG